MKTRTIKRTLKNPEHYAPLLAIRSAGEYNAAVTRLNELVDEVGDNTRDPRYRLIDTLSVLIEAYDEEHHAIPDVSGVDMLKFLMEQHGLSQRDLPEIGSQGVVSEILRGRRELNVRQIAALSERFHLSPGVFFLLRQSRANANAVADRSHSARIARSGGNLR
jgi:HTH-type transcriptional regulator/antitoxin HigA